MKAAIITCGIYLYSEVSQKILVCHATNSPWNKWSIPKGLQDEGEDAYTSALRELYEETGLELKSIQVTSEHRLAPVKYQKQNKILESFLIITSSDLSEQKWVCHTYTEKSFPEIDSWKWITTQQAVKWLHEAQQKNLSHIEELIAAANR